MDTILRVLVYVLVGTILLIANFWFLSSMSRAMFSGDVVILPFEVIGGDGDAAAMGRSLAQMLRARLSQVQRQLSSSQEWLVGQTGAELENEARQRRDPAAALMLLRPVAIPAAVFEPASIDVKVGNVEVGGVVPWLQRAIVKPRTLAFTVYLEENGEAGAAQKAVITGNLGAAGEFETTDLWLETSGNADELATATAYALIQRKVAEGGQPEVEALELTEFRDLLDSLVDLADLNRSIASGRPPGVAFSQLLTRFESLIEKLPRWYELRYLTANVAERAGSERRAVAHYRDLRKMADPDREVAGRRELQPIVATRLEALDVAPVADPSTSSEEQDFIAAASAYAQRLGLTTPDPTIVFQQLEPAGQLAIWDGGPQHYAVDPRYVDHPGLDRYVALMGRFMDNHFARCFAAANPSGDMTLWNELRSSLVEYVISTEPDARGPSDQRAYGTQLFSALQALGSADREATRRLALAMLDGYECDWTQSNLVDRAVDINAGLGGGLTEEMIRQAFAGYP